MNVQLFLTGQTMVCLGVIYLSWFKIGIEEKDPMDQEEDERRGNIEFGYIEKKIWTDLDDYFQLFEDGCRGGHYNKMAYDEFYSILVACSQMCLILFYFFSL